jgi:hypothetical protein
MDRDHGGSEEYFSRGAARCIIAADIVRVSPVASRVISGLALRDDGRLGDL